MNIFQLCGIATSLRMRAKAQTGVVAPDGFYVGQALADMMAGENCGDKTISLVALTIREYKNVPEHLAAIVDGMER